jgi:hypothetical protein
MTDKTQKDDSLLDQYFDAARGADTDVPDALKDRILKDALAEMNRSEPAKDTPPTSPMARFFEALGGWPAFAGLATATVAGVWIGFQTPLDLGAVGQAEASFELSDLADGVWAFELDEG